jgi:hypothetical protein
VRRLAVGGGEFGGEGGGCGCVAAGLGLLCGCVGLVLCGCVGPLLCGCVGAVLQLLRCGRGCARPLVGWMPGARSPPMPAADTAAVPRPQHGACGTAGRPLLVLAFLPRPPCQWRVRAPPRSLSAHAEP